jgi:hypothetical protein
MKRLDTLTSFAKAAQLLATTAAAANITHEEIAHLRAIEPEFDDVCKAFVEMFGDSTTFTTTTTDTTTTEVTTELPTAPEITQHTPDTTKEESNSVSTTPAEVWKHHPNLEGVELSTLGHVKVNGQNVTPRMVGGYMKFYVGPGKVYALASAMLTTFSGRTDNSMAPYYLDGNKENCALSNLRWATRDSSLTTSQVERACKIIAENAHLNESELLNLLVRERTIKSVTALRSILSGNWRTISDRYFVVRRGLIYPTLETASTTSTTEAITEPEVDDSGNLKGILSLTNDPAFVRKLYSERIDAKRVSSDDQVALILSYIMDGKDSAPEIQRAIRKDFGKRVMISNAEIQRIIG